MYLHDKYIFMYQFFWRWVEFELRVPHLLSRCSTTWAILTAPFCVGYFWYRVSRTICLAVFKPQLSWSLLWVARITGWATSAWCYLSMFYEVSAYCAKVYFIYCTRWNGYIFSNPFFMFASMLYSFQAGKGKVYVSQSTNYLLAFIIVVLLCMWFWISRFLLLAVIQSKNIKWKIPESNNPQVFNCIPFWGAWYNPVSFFPGNESCLCLAYPHCICYTPISHSVVISIIRSTVMASQFLCSCCPSIVA
jgi:hypothetical protein